MKEIIMYRTALYAEKIVKSEITIDSKLKDKCIYLINKFNNDKLISLNDDNNNIYAILNDSKSQSEAEANE